MASQWYYRIGDDEQGPIAFRELIQLVRGGMVREDDLVRAEWPADWQRADSVVGLFYMSRREEAFVSPVSDAALEHSNAADTVTPALAPSRSSIRLPWRFPPLFCRAAKVAHVPSAAAANRQVITEAASFTQEECASVADPLTGNEPSLARSGAMLDAEPIERTSGPATDEWGTTVAEALSAARLRDATLARQQEHDKSRSHIRDAVYVVCAWTVHVGFRPVVFLFGWMVSAGRTTTRDRVAAGLAVLERWLPRSGILRVAFKAGIALFATNLAAYGVLRWSERQASRFPGAESGAVHVFPIVGECGPVEVAIVVFHVALFAGITAYGIASALEAYADE